MFFLHLLCRMTDSEDSISKKYNGCIDSKAELNNFDALFATLQNDLATMWQGSSEVSDAIQWFKMVKCISSNLFTCKSC